MSALSRDPIPLPFHAAASYTDRVSKARYIALKYGPALRESVLDVGCDRALLRGHLAPGVRYVGVDASPGADVVIDLDREDLPFPARSFETVVAADVLEHLERLHAVFDRLCEIAARRVIVALPNPVRSLMLEIARGTGGVGLKHYGLPLDPPRDRHRWFFGAQEAADFLRARGRRNGFDAEQLDVVEHGVAAWPAGDGRDRAAHPNISQGTTWCVLRRSE